STSARSAPLTMAETVVLLRETNPDFLHHLYAAVNVKIRFGDNVVTARTRTEQFAILTDGEHHALAFRGRENLAAREDAAISICGSDQNPNVARIRGGRKRWAKQRAEVHALPSVKAMKAHA